MTPLKKQQKQELKSKYINRELSWLKFNDRVLLEAQNIDNPLYERVKFLLSIKVYIMFILGDHCV